MKTLVADDDPTSRLVLEQIVCRYGDVESCADGVDAVRASHAALERGHPYDLICMDIYMPAMNGLEALQLIRQDEESFGRPHAARVIVITSSEEAGNIERAFGKLCDAYLVKPVDGARLLDIVACLCDLGSPSPAL